MGNIIKAFKKIFGNQDNKKSCMKILDNYTSFSEVEHALRNAGLETSQLIVGIDYTKSNSWKGGLPYFKFDNLHTISNINNPYQEVLSVMCKALAPFDDDNFIDAYGFGDYSTTDKSVFSMNNVTSEHGTEEVPCYKLEGVLERYSIITPFVNLSGPTSFAPIIRKAIDLVKVRKQYHILIIIADGAVDSVRDTKNAIIEASHYPLSIIVIGVGKGTWELMEEFDDELPERKFDNFQFVDFYKVMQKCENNIHTFAMHALMEIPEQYSYIKKHLL